MRKNDASVRTAEPSDIARVAWQMRMADEEELRAVYGTQAGEETRLHAGMRFSTVEAAFCGFDGRGEPVCVAATPEIRPGVVSLGFFASYDFAPAGQAISRVLKRELIDPLPGRGVHRMEAASLATHTDAHRWLRFFGLEAAHTMRGFGAYGEDFILFEKVQ